MHLKPISLGSFCGRRKEGGALLMVPEELGPVGPTVHDMVKGTGEVRAQRPWHGLLSEASAPQWGQTPY